MKYVVIGLIIVVGAIIVWVTFGVGKAFIGGFSRGVVEAAQSNGDFHTAYRRGFKQSFLRNCEHGSTEVRTQAYCTCAEDGIEKRFDDAGLMSLATNASADQRQAAGEIIRACYLKASSP